MQTRIFRVYFTHIIDGNQRLILNLKSLNKYLEYKHFPMQTIQTILTLIQFDCYTETADLKDGY